MSHKLVSLYIGEGEYYARIDVDNVIAEMKALKAQAEDDCAYWKMRHRNAENAMHETEEACMYLTKSERHQKYKRCLAMAKLCEFDMEQWVEGSLRWQRRKNWHKRWLELAEKFKEAK